jgi:AcrR family transcriptional regulator
MTGTRRSSDTKAAILVAARTRFAAEGYRSTTVRAVARDAGIDPALVMRYFGGKADLFVAATDIDLRIPDLSDVPVAEHGERLVAHFLAHWDEATPEGEVLLSLLRSAATDDAAAASMRVLFAGQLVPALRPLVADESELPQRAGLVASQMLGLALTRLILALPPLAAMPADALVANAGATIQRYLHEPLRS